MPYSPMIVQPMKEELTSIGFQELLSPEDVDHFMEEESDSALLVINSVCGCAAGSARPGVRLALEGEIRPERLGTVFAGQETEATARLRGGYLSELPPSSPAIALFKNGELAYFVPRHRIEGRSPKEVATDLRSAFERELSPASAT